MSSLRSLIEQNMKEAMKTKDVLRLSVLRILLSVAHNKLIDKKYKEGSAELSDEEFLNVIRSEVKKRKDSVREFRRGGREEMANKEEEEIKVLTAYLPAELTDNELEKTVEDVIKELGHLTPKDFGKAMSHVMKRVAGRAGGDRVKEILNKTISSGK